MHSVFVSADFFACLPLPAKTKEVDSMEIARIAKNIFFIPYFLNLKYCLLIRMVKYSQADASTRTCKRPGDYRPGDAFFHSIEKLSDILQNFFQPYKNFLWHKP